MQIGVFSSHFVAKFVLVHLNVKSDDLSGIGPLSQLEVLLQGEQVVRLSHLVRHAIVRHPPNACMPQAGEQRRSNSEIELQISIKKCDKMDILTMLKGASVLFIDFTVVESYLKLIVSFSSKLYC